MLRPFLKALPQASKDLILFTADQCRIIILQPRKMYVYGV